MKNDLFFDETSKTLYNQLPKNSLVQSHVMLNIEQFEIGSRYVTAKIQNRYADEVTINIQGGRPGIELQESFFKMKEENNEFPSYVYLITRLVQDSKIFARKLPVIGYRDWLLIYEDSLLEFSKGCIRRIGNCDSLIHLFFYDSKIAVVLNCMKFDIAPKKILNLSN